MLAVMAAIMFGIIGLVVGMVIGFKWAVRAVVHLETQGDLKFLDGPRMMRRDAHNN